ncbi:MAG: ABC transporter ATP-binding protein, partial [Gaiellaceae bacterium]
MADVAFDEVDKVYENGFHAVQDLTLAIADGEFLVLVGPSGCGKTTALRMVAGLEEISDGTVSIGGKVVNKVSPKERDIAMVFQNYALYPHLSVAENIAFGLRLRKTPKRTIEERVDWAAKMLDLTPYLERRPKQLSGGQRQRVAMGRAIVRHPQVFLMDEPLSNLDAKLRVQMRADIAKLQRDIGTTTIYVTHDQVEAMTMGDRVAVMTAGVLQQVDRPQRLFDEPANLFVAGFIGTPPINLLEAGVTVDGDAVTLSLAGQQLRVDEAALRRYPGLRNSSGHTVVIGLRAGDLDLATARPDLPSLTARLDIVEALGSESVAYFRVDAPVVRTEG